MKKQTIKQNKKLNKTLNKYENEIDFKKEDNRRKKDDKIKEEKRKEKEVKSIAKENERRKRESRKKLIKAINQRLKDAIKKYGEDSFVTKKIMKYIINTGHYRMSEINGKEIPQIINDKFWDMKNVGIEEKLKSLKFTPTPVSLYNKKQEEKIRKEMEYEELIINAETEIEKNLFEDEYNKLKEKSLDEFVKEEDDLHNLIISNLSVIYDWHPNLTNALRRTSDSNVRLTITEEMELRTFLSNMQTNEDKTISAIKNGEYKTGYGVGLGGN